MSNSQPSTASNSPWLFGPVSDLGIGCGLLFWVFFLWMALSVDSARAFLPFSAAAVAVLGMLIGHPHYGATILRVYEHRSDRQRYAYFAVFGSLLIWGLFAIGVHVDLVGSLMLTLYLMIAPWHYAGQNYGIAVMLMRRQGVSISRHAQRFFHASFVLSTLFTILSLHGPEVPAREVGFYGGTGYNFVSVGMSAVSQNVAISTVAVLYLASLVGSAVLLKRKATFKQLIPAVAITGTQALWFSVPLLSSHYGLLGNVEPLSPQNAAYMFFWASIGHSIQYLWVTTYFAERAEHPTRRIPFYAKTVLAGAAAFSIPAFLLAPDIMGKPTLDGGLMVMISTVVNLHHYLLDAVIWKLRQGRIADVLVRNQAAQQIGPEHGVGWFRPALISVGALSVLVMSVDMISLSFASRAVSREDTVALSSWINTLEFIHHPRATYYYNLSQIQRRRGNMDEAIANGELAQSMSDQHDYRSNLCRLYASVGRTSEAIDACRPLVSDRPDDARAAMNLALLLARDPERTTEALDEAIGLAEAASAARDEDPYFLEQLASIYGSAGQPDAMRDVAVRALESDSARNDEALAGRLKVMAANQ